MIFAAVLALPLLARAGEEARAKPPPVVAAVWLEGTGADAAVVVAVYRAPDAPPAVAHAGFGWEGHESPSDYGTIEPSSWRGIRVGPGEVVRAKLPVDERGVPYVLVAARAATEPIDVHELIDGGDHPGTLWFGRPGSGGAVTVDRHLVTVGDSVGIRVAAPTDDGFFREETFEILRVARRFGVGSDDPDGLRGFVRATWRRPIGKPPARELAGEEGEKRIRSHFTKPDCPWAERHVGWMDDLFILEYLRPEAIGFSLDTSPVKAAGRISDLWRGYGAIAVESIWPNGFGGSSSNCGMPDVLVVPRGTSIREEVLE